jgi:hypothetical protein
MCENFVSEWKLDENKTLPIINNQIAKEAFEVLFFLEKQFGPNFLINFTQFLHFCLLLITLWEPFHVIDSYSHQENSKSI